MSAGYVKIGDGYVLQTRCRECGRVIIQPAGNVPETDPKAAAQALGFASLLCMRCYEAEHQPPPKRTADPLGADEVLEMLTRRDVDDALQVMGGATSAGTTLERIAGAVEWYDRQKKAKDKGLLIWKIQQGGADPRRRKPQAVPEYDTSRLPVLFKGHEEWLYDTGRTRERCDGDLMVVEATFPLVTVRCDQCGFEANLTHRILPPRLLRELGVIGEA